MYDLHCHLLPAIDDGPVDLDTALEMARLAVADGITTIACTPHIYPGVYENTADGIRSAIELFRSELAGHGIALTLVEGADVHLAPDLADGIRNGRIPTLAASRYLLLEPPHHVAPPRFEEAVFQLMSQGIVPVITHPERLSWVDSHFDVFARLAEHGAWMQITAGALTGRFGSRPRTAAERFVGEGLCMILATDAHHPRRRPPFLMEAREAATRLVGREEAEHLVVTRPAGIVQNLPPGDLPPAPSINLATARRASGGGSQGGLISRMLGRWSRV
ncbi:tyrosine-protein phosphatase [Lysobacter changpingensis]|uniref:tyrosine-protein phosphatase n=1 Tax=Lysobacter changpingensis TaxID=2792784 RepID=UPI001A8E3434|nr:CpsB/CapC family capsule biosynthesis tyrosine phosphatase [Lysobacter changpingensis]